MKVLISRKDFKDTTAGVPKKVLQEVRFFRGKGFEPYVISETMNYELLKEFGGVGAKTLRWPISGYFRRKFYQMQVNRWVKKNEPKIVIGHGDIISQNVLFIHNCVHLAHELIEGRPLPSDHEVGRIHEEILRQGKYQLLICNSELMKNDLIHRFRIDEKKAVVIYPEVNLLRFQVEDPNSVKNEWRAKLGLSEDDFIFGLITSGNFKKRNLGILIEAFHDVARDHKNAKLFVAGGNIGQEYRDQVKLLGLESKVIFAPPIIEVKNYYYLIDTFVLPAHIEEFGRSVLEAMYCGKIVITTDKVGASEILEGASRDYILSSSRDKMALISLMLKSLNDQSVGKINHSTALKYSADSQNDQFGNELRKFAIL